jgi:HEAT repeat protein
LERRTVIREILGARSNTQFGDDAWLTSIVAEFQQSRAPAIPEIIGLLYDQEKTVRRKGAELLGKLSERGKVPNLLMGRG